MGRSKRLPEGWVNLKMNRQETKNGLILILIPILAVIVIAGIFLYVKKFKNESILGINYTNDVDYQEFHNGYSPILENQVDLDPGFGEND